MFRGENKSYFRFKLKIRNIGSTPIENAKLIIQLNGNYEDIDDENVDTQFIPQRTQVDIEINKEKGSFFVVPRRSTLALEEEYISSMICIKPKIEGADIELAWKLVSNSCNKEGLLRLKIATYLIQKEVDEYVDFRQHVRVVKSIEDYIEEDE